MGFVLYLGYLYINCIILYKSRRWCINAFWTILNCRGLLHGEAARSPQAHSPPAAASGKVPYRVTNWPEYERALVQRGNWTIWFDEVFLRERWRPAPTGQRGAPFRYSDAALQALLTLKAVFDLPYRMVEGLAGSIVRWLGVARSIPDHTLLSRRAKPLTVQILRPQRTGPIHVVVDSTGLKVYGEGEWTVRPHGAGQRRTWRKVHLAVDAEVKDVLSVEVTTEQWTDGKVFAGLREQIDGALAQVDGDGAYDTRGVYAAAGKRGAPVAVPPRDHAVPWEADHPRTQALAAIAAQGLSAWKRAVGYHRRSLAENASYRLKQLFGDRLASRRFETQVTEVHVWVAALNIMTYLGLPVSVPVGVMSS